MLQKIVSKASQSGCRYKIAAVGLNKKGEPFCWATNKQFINNKGGGLHAETILMRRHKRKIKTIIICRTNNSGDILPIDPCEKCQKLAQKLGIKIKSIQT